MKPKLNFGIRAAEYISNPNTRAEALVARKRTEKKESQLKETVVYCKENKG